jgi:AAHS family 4-hydroxybenzoate transporter-like MFS transporter
MTHGDATAPAALDVAALIDSRPLGWYQKLAVALCALVVFLDGFDTQAIALVVPALAEAWQLDARGFGPVFGAGLVGALFGAIVLGGLGDRIGRRAALLASVLLFGACSLATALAGSFSELIAWRFLTGIGLGGALPNAVAITSEYAPRRLRATLVSIMFIGFPIGALTAGFTAAVLVPAYGWRSLFLLGGAVPLALLPVLAWALPESLRHLVLHGAAPERIRAIVRRVAPDARIERYAAFAVGEGAPPRARVRALFAAPMARTTLLLWLLVAANQFVLLLLANWLPVLLHGSGMGIATAIISAAILNLGGVAGALAFARLIDASGARRVLGPAYVAGALLTASLGWLEGSAAATLAVIGAIGFCIIGGQIGTNALAAALYPTSIRGTGVGWAVGIGRIGAILGPVVGGMLLAGGAGLPTVFGVAAAGAIVCAAALALMRGRET